MDKKCYKDIEAEATKLYTEGNIAKAVELMEDALNDFPEHAVSISLDLSFFYIRLEDYEKCANTIKSWLDKGVWFPKQYFMQVLDRDEFKSLLPQWDKLKEEAQAAAKPELLVKLPSSYDKNKKYPLFIALHGWGEDLKLFSKYWHSELIDNDFILVLPQSSQVIGSFNYCWSDRDKAHAEINQMYSHIAESYKLDVENIFVGGFSEGATLALEAALNKDYIPIKGVIALNPSKPELFDEPVLKAAKDKGIKICIITGDKDNDYPAQLEMKEAFESVGVSYSISVKENWGHWFPEDLRERIDSAIRLINQ